MKYKLNFVVAISLLLVAVNCSCASLLPKGWRFPNESDYKGDWLLYREQVEVPFHVQADFNGDNHDDDAWILFAENMEEWGVFVFLSKNGGGRDVIKLERNDMSIVPQNMGISLLSPKEYTTTCGKGYSACAHDESETIHPQFPAINFFTYESANSMFYWDSSIHKFRRVWLSD